jgi:hypothetical protein
MELTRQAGNDPSLVGLMRIYKDYYPDVIVGDTLVGRASVFTVSISLFLFKSVLRIHSIQIKNGAKDLVKSRTFIFRKRKMVYYPNRKLSESLGKVRVEGRA